MNVADSRRVASELERLGCRPVSRIEDADVIVLNTCVVRQRPEDRAVSRLMSLRPLKKHRPETIIALMGCMVGVKNPTHLLCSRFPFVDVFMAPSDPEPLLEVLRERDAVELATTERTYREALQDGEWTLPILERGRLVAAHLPVVLGCSHACSYCVIPYRRGPEHSRPSADVITEARRLVDQGVREVTLLGQIVDRYGLDLPEDTTLAKLLRLLHDVEGLERIRFLTSHPLWMTSELLEAVAGLPRVCEHIEVPVQAGDDQILRAMRRGYTVQDYRQLVGRIREVIAGVAIHTDVIVGFPGETEAQFRHTYELLAELKLDKAHIARYSPRPNTLSARQLIDDVPEDEKERRRRELDELQAQIVGEINQQFVGTSVEVLVEEKRKDRWCGRTRGNKLVFFEDERDLLGQLIGVNIEWAGPWSMRGSPVS
jgi:tRNA-2-methylthio-N6-dimethylallyladenosine synthase